MAEFSIIDLKIHKALIPLYLSVKVAVCRNSLNDMLCVDVVKVSFLVKYQRWVGVDY